VKGENPINFLADGGKKQLTDGRSQRVLCAWGSGGGCST